MTVFQHKSTIYSAFVLECPFPDSPDPEHAALKVRKDHSLAASDLRLLNEALSEIGVPWFDLFNQQHYDFRYHRRWIYGYALQTDGPFIANFTFTRDPTGYAVALDDGSRTTTRWSGFTTVPLAVAAVRRHIEERLTSWSLGLD